MPRAEDTFLTLTETTESLYKEKGSKFYGYAFPVADEADARQQLDHYRKQHHASRHVCYAWALGPKGEHVRSSDAGEPANSAGKPMLNQLQTRELTNAMVVVVRYFGGTKLGVPGLIHAYRTAASDAIEQGTTREEIVGTPLSFRFLYTEMNDVMRLVKEHEMRILDQDFAEDCKMKIWVRKKEEALVRERLTNIRNLHWVENHQE